MVNHIIEIAVNYCNMCNKTYRLNAISGPKASVKNVTVSKEESSNYDNINAIAVV